ncbi:hypothetical protein ACXY7D_11985 [Sphingomonas melonis]
MTDPIVFLGDFNAPAEIHGAEHCTLSINPLSFYDLDTSIFKKEEGLGGFIGGLDGKPILPLAKPSTGNRHQRRAAAAGKVKR